MGLRVCRVHYSLDLERRFCASDYDERESDHPLVSLWHSLLLLREDVPKVVEEQLSAQALKAVRRHLMYHKDIEKSTTSHVIV